jgi:hypothetical protein
MSLQPNHPTPCHDPVMSVAVLRGIPTDLPQFPAVPDSSAPLSDMRASSPPGLKTVHFGGRSQQVWPYTTAEFPAREQDPINLIFVGQADPRNIRAALLSLDGNRPAFPAHPMFGHTWKDAIGGHQAAYSEAETWTGSVIQLECGDYQPLRFHARLFPAGPWTLVNAHLDVIIPGTADHEVVAWELARQLVVHDFQRSGLLASTSPLGETDFMHPPAFRQIRPEIFAGLPAELKQLLLHSGSITEDGRLLTSGRATLLDLGDVAPEGPLSTSQDVLIEFGQIIPKPFCNRGDEYILVHGPVRLQQRVEQGACGGLTSRMQGAGELRVTPVDPATRQPTGPTSHAEVTDRYTGVMSDDEKSVAMWQHRQVKPGAGAAERETVDMRVGPHGRVHYSRDEQTGS